MLEILRKYQRSLFAVVAVLIIASFTFFGTFNTFTNTPKGEDPILGKSVTGASIHLSELLDLTRFLASDQYDFFLGGTPNFCNDGVIKNDFLKPHIARLLWKEAFDTLKEEGELRLKKAKRFTPYQHPQIPFLSAAAVWNHILPEIESELHAIQAEETFSLASFASLETLYLDQTRLPPIVLKQILLTEQNKLGLQGMDFRLQNLDLSLFGFHNLTDWFGKEFLEVAAAFVLNGAELAKAKGLEVTLQEAKGSLIYNFNSALKLLKEQGYNPNITLKEHLQMHGFTEKKAVEVWQKVLLFRKYFEGISDAVFMDRLPYQEFASFALKTFLIDEYRWPKSLCLKTTDDVKRLYKYLDLSLHKKKTFPLEEGSFISVEEMEKKCPSLVEEGYRLQLSRTLKSAASYLAPLSEVWAWEVEHWEELLREFPKLGAAKTKEARFQRLEKLGRDLRELLDQKARVALLQEHPDWISEMLAKKPVETKEVFLSQARVSLPGIENVVRFREALQKAEPFRYEEGDHIFEILQVEKVHDKRILTFEEAQMRGALDALAKKVSDQEVDSRFLFSLTEKALQSVQKEGTDSLWIRKEKDPLLAQFRLHCLEKEERRLKLEELMGQDGFFLKSDTWTPIYVPEEGEVAFSYIREEKGEVEPLLEQIRFGKAIVAEDAKRYLAKRLLEEIKSQRAFLERTKAGDSSGSF